MAVTPHGDDVTFFAGGTLAAWAEAGADIQVVRVTQDEKDSWELDRAATIETNRREFQAAMACLGVRRTIDLDHQDCELLDVSHGVLREQLIRLIREHRPEVLVTFDPAVTDDENPDHAMVARAAADAAWAAGFPSFHPEHGTEPHSPLGCYFFTRELVHGETVVDIGATLERKLAALACHRNMLRVLLAELQQRAGATGLDIPALSRLALDDSAELWGRVIGAGAALAAQGTEVTFAERFRSTLLTEDHPLVQILRSLEAP